MKIADKDIIEKFYSSKSLKDLTTFKKLNQLFTGIKTIDSEFGFPAGYYVIIGNQGVGKSWFALWLSRVFYRHNQVASIYFSLEMPEPLVRKRLLQQWSDLTQKEFDSGDGVREAINLISRDVILVDDFYSMNTSNRTPENFGLWIDEYYKLGYRIFHMDHFHELGGASVNETNQKTVELWGLKFQQILKKYPDIWLFIFAQPNSRDFNKKILDRNSLRGSKSLIDRCDYVLSLNKNINIDTESGVIISNEDDRKIILYLDKTRYTTKPNIGFRLFFSETGNFYPISSMEK